MVKINILDKGFVEYVNHMGTDFDVDNDARTSTGTEARSDKERINLIRYLLRNKHTTPFEGCILKLKVKAPILVWRQWMRHRTLSYSEESARYQQLAPDYYLPSLDRLCKQSEDNHQGSGDNLNIEKSQSIISSWHEQQSNFELSYQYLDNEIGLAHELSRLNMPVSHYSTVIVTGNLLNWFRFLSLRLEKHAQEEIRLYANAISEIIKKIFPICHQAFIDYWNEAITFSRIEIEILKEILKDQKIKFIEAIEHDNKGLTKREINELYSKLW